MVKAKVKVKPVKVQVEVEPVIVEPETISNQLKTISKSIFEKVKCLFSANPKS